MLTDGIFYSINVIWNLERNLIVPERWAKVDDKLASLFWLNLDEQGRVLI